MFYFEMKVLIKRVQLRHIIQKNNCFNALAKRDVDSSDCLLFECFQFNCPRIYRFLKRTMMIICV